MSLEPSLSEAVELLKGEFLEVYADAREQLAHVAPILVLLEDTLTILRRTRQSEASTTSDRVNFLKSIAHIPVTLFVALERLGDAPLDEAARSHLGKLDQVVKVLQGSLSALGEDAGQRAADAASKILDATTRCASGAISDGVASVAALAAYTSGVSAAMRDCASFASHLQLVSLHGAATKLLHDLDPSERRALQVVVVGTHEGRARSLGLQYFSKLLGESPGDEERVVYAEGLRSVEEARNLAGAHRLDVVIGNAFFGDPRRLHRDVLGDAAKDELTHLELAPLKGAF